jgi:hypothetical protein
MVAKLEEEFKDLNLKYSIGGQISFDVFPIGCALNTVPFEVLLRAGDLILFRVVGFSRFLLLPNDATDNSLARTFVGIGDWGLGIRFFSESIKLTS